MLAGNILSIICSLWAGHHCEATLKTHHGRIQQRKEGKESVLGRRSRAVEQRVKTTWWRFVFFCAESRKTPQNSSAEYFYLKYTTESFTSQSVEGGMLSMAWKSGHLIGENVQSFGRAHKQLREYILLGGCVVRGLWRKRRRRRGSGGGLLGSGGANIWNRVFLFNDMQQMWNEAVAAMMMWSEKERKKRRKN